MDIEPHNQPINTNQVCTKLQCTDNENHKKIKCVKCKREVHYVCTNLPLYQLRLFFTKNYRSFVCVNCVEIPEDFKTTYNNQEETILNHYKREIKACENIIMVQKENENKLINGIRKMKQKQNEKDEHLKNTMENKFDEFEKKIKEIIKDEIKSNIDSKNNQHKIDQKSSFASIVKNVNQENILIPKFRKLLQEEKIQDIEEERQKDIRKSNLIIHGIKECEERTNDDRTSVNNLFHDVGSNSTVKYMTRIGIKRPNYTRPIKVVLESAHEVYLITKKLINLKGNKKYQGISVTEDFTRFERSLIKEWKNKAAERSAREPNFVWRVRGSPKSGLYL